MRIYRLGVVRGYGVGMTITLPTRRLIGWAVICAGVAIGLGLWALTARWSALIAGATVVLVGALVLPTPARGGLTGDAADGS